MFSFYKDLLDVELSKMPPHPGAVPKAPIPPPKPVQLQDTEGQPKSNLNAEQLTALKAKYDEDCAEYERQMVRMSFTNKFTSIYISVL